ncbi:MauE/DoxX family redox-associated membrane protein [Embleya scabrispora]|uniref:MauE/DoxX family redox-associated membrane protein n=1 Tax=Embleya scabrispora TaxID=159449 RepID=UPI00037B4E8A|nr:MauE/DoxX family redox-associated membrane protein [Embleya scabrispora]
MGYIYVGCACLIGLVFAASAVTKLRDFDGFVDSIPGLVPMRAGSTRPIGYAVVAGEISVPVLVPVPPTRGPGFAIAGVLLAAFTAAIGAALRRGRRSSCRCFGASDAPLGPRHLVRNGVLLAASIAGLSATGVGSSADLLPPLAGCAVAMVVGLVGALLIISLDDIVDLFARNA